jgi:hypothetical protein
MNVLSPFFLSGIFTSGTYIFSILFPTPNIPNRERTPSEIEPVWAGLNEKKSEILP